MKKWGLFFGRFQHFFLFFIMFTLLLASLPNNSYCQTTTKTDTVALSIPYPNKKQVDEILKGNDSPDTKAMLKKINEDIKKLQKILPKDSKVMKAKVTKYSVEYAIECKFFIKQNADPMNALIKFMEKFKELNYPEFVFFRLILLPNYIHKDEKNEIHILFMYKSGNICRQKGFVKNGLPVSLPGQIKILKALNSLTDDNFRICSILFNKYPNSFMLNLMTTGKKNPLQTISTFFQRIQRETDMKHTFFRMQHPAYTNEDIEERFWYVEIKY